MSFAFLSEEVAAANGDFTTLALVAHARQPRASRTWCCSAAWIGTLGCLACTARTRKRLSRILLHMTAMLLGYFWVDLFGEGKGARL